MENLPQVSGRTSLPKRSARSSVQRALDDRLTFSETTSIAGDLLAQFPNAREVSDGFIGALASVLTQYPRQVVFKCADPLRGIARDSKFLSIAETVSWLEKQTEPMRADVDREKRIAEQFRARDDWQGNVVSPRLKEMGKAWLDRSDPIARELVAENLAAEAARKDMGLQRIQQANQAVFERECKAAGIDPARGVSPALLKALGERHADT